MAKLSVQPLLQTAVTRGIKNVVPLVVNAILWALTVWIPYINIGTTIGLYAGVIGKMARGEIISPLEIFNPDYRKHMGSFFLVMGLMFAGIGFAFLLFIAPGIVLSFAWIIAPVLVVDQAMSPTDALQKSNELTWGNKGTIFISQLVLVIAIMILQWIAGAIGDVSAALGGLLSFVISLVAVAAGVALLSAIYGELNDITPDAETERENA